MDQREGKGRLLFLCPSTHILDFVVAGAILEEFLRFVPPRTQSLELGWLPHPRSRMFPKGQEVKLRK